MINVYIDGLCQPVNPGGIATYGYVFEGDVNEIGFGFVGQGSGMSNNVAEYAGLIAALQHLIKYGKQQEQIVIYSDSRLLINQMKDKWKAHGGLYLSYYKQAKRLTTTFQNVSFKWLPREQNTRADQLSRDAYEQYLQLDKVQTRHTPLIKKEEQQKACINCNWMKVVGPHIGCYEGDKWQKWISKKSAIKNSCKFYVQNS